MARVLFQAKNQRNYFIPFLLLALALANGLAHAGAHGWLPVPPLTGLHLAVALMTVLETVIAGRIVPSFMANASRTVPWRNPLVDRVAIASTAVAFLMWAFNAPAGLTAVVAAIVQGVRVWGWRPVRTFGTPLLWVLHLSHAWIIVALLVLAASGIGLTNAQPVLHLLTIGATGGLIIISMTARTALDDTGRFLKTGALEVVCYFLLQCALVLRALPLFGIAASAYVPMLWASSFAWSGCFLLYLIKDVPILISPAWTVNPDDVNEVLTRKDLNRPIFLQFSDDMHFTGLAVKAHGQFLIAIQQNHRISSNTLDLLRAEIKAVSQALLGDH